MTARKVRHGNDAEIPLTVAIIDGMSIGVEIRFTLPIMSIKNHSDRIRKMYSQIPMATKW